MALLQLQQFPEIPKKIRTLLLLWLAWFYALIWSGNFQKEFLMLNWFTTYLHLPLMLEIFPFLSSLIVIFEYLWSHSKSEVCLIDFPAAVAGEFWLYIRRCGYFLVHRCSRIFAFGFCRYRWVFHFPSSLCVLVFFWLCIGAFYHRSLLRCGWGWVLRSWRGGWEKR